MSKFGIYSDKPSISFESHLEKLEEQIKNSLLNLRDFVKSLGNNIIEEVRPHRIVYAKSLTFRTFLDIQPRTNCLIVSIRKSRNQPVIAHTVNTSQEVEDVKYQIAEAYKTIS
ncbi:MAG TPA: hypothetical protein VE818_03610 [Nitrososphaeraceae archaeon]|jgi:hypothetical protein|nr:hypothetical protein [Nitrososphaeraceae archaeon]